MIKSFVLLACALLSACVTTDEINAHRDALAAWERVEIARANASARRFEALSEVARSGGESAKIAVVMAVNGGGGEVRVAAPMPAVPDTEGRAFRWASLILPVATTLGAQYSGYRLGIAQSDNSARIAEAGYGAITAGYLGMRDFGIAGFDALAARPGGITINGSGNSAAMGGSAMLDTSHRCSPVFGSGGAGGSGGATGASSTGAGGAGAPGGAAPGMGAPFNC